jgi:predicted ATPase
MEITVKNFGTISEANVHIGGLTVLTGENDTGKSTIGKVLFSLVKAFARYKEDLEEDKEARIMLKLEEIYFTLRRHVNIAEQDQLRDFFHPRRYYNQLRLDSRRTIDESLRLVETNNLIGVVPDFIVDLTRGVLGQVENILNESDDKQTSIHRAIKKAFYSEFKEEILQQGHSSSVAAEITLNDGASQLVNIVWSKDNVVNYHADDELGFSDATYVESPAIIQFNNLVKMSKTLFDDKANGRLSVPLHLKDLSAKLSDSIYNFGELGLFPENNDVALVSNTIKNLLGGAVEYDTDKRDFVLTRDGINISSSNIASGIKALGILDLLVKGGNARKNSLLILDEPEVNLHPKWQVAYCEIICALVANDVDVIVTTHSPYIIEALKEFSDRRKLTHNFYLAYKDDARGFSKFADITNNISHAIDLLAAPLYKLNTESLDDF